MKSISLTVVISFLGSAVWVSSFFLIFIFGCAGSLLLCVDFLYLPRVGATVPSPWCAGFSLWWVLLWQSVGLQLESSVVVAQGLC